jgi:hypothetical protein
MKKTLKYTIIYSLVIAILSCGKGGDPPATTPPPTTNPPPTQPPAPKNCTLIGIEQQNTGGKPDFALTLTLNGLNPLSLVVFDSLANKRLIENNFSIITTDSIRIDQYQYLKLDANRRVSVFVTRSDMTQAASSDIYRYEYTYNNEGYLSTKKLFINGSTTAYYTTSYTYSNNLLIKCMMSIGESNLKVLESDLTYDTNTTAKGWIYNFPDAFESYMYGSLLNFGNKPARPLSQVITKIFNPTNGNILDTWNTTYSSYILNTDGYIVSVRANGDLQQGMALLYGRTIFKYSCQ